MQNITVNYTILHSMLIYINYRCQLFRKHFRCCYTPFAYSRYLIVKTTLTEAAPKEHHDQGKGSGGGRANVEVGTQALTNVCLQLSCAQRLGENGPNSLAFLYKDSLFAETCEQASTICVYFNKFTCILFRTKARHFLNRGRYVLVKVRREHFYKSLPL